jgi:hypothetical protein
MFVDGKNPYQQSSGGRVFNSGITRYETGKFA